MKFRFVGKDGKAYAAFRLRADVTLTDVIKAAFGNQPQDPERAGNGWDIEAV